MFQNSSVFVITSRVNNDCVWHVELDANTQRSICETFSDCVKELLFDKEKIVFNGNYKPEHDEFLYINDFQLDEKIKNVIRNPLGVPSFRAEMDSSSEIKAVFVGEVIDIEDQEQFSIAFQRFRKEQYISTKWYHLFFEKNTFFRREGFGISISDSVDCFYTNNELQFRSFHIARQIFDLRDYYRLATNEEVKSFGDNPKLMIEDEEAFEVMADTRVRRKIALIHDAQILEKFAVSDIKKRARQVGIKVEVKAGKIVIPNDKKRLKVLLGFLDEEAYKGPFSENVYLANSKRKI